jgi:two-component system OmpR family sensor kinase
MTLRTRLLLGLVALAAFGLTVAGTITYRQTRDDLLARVNHQLASAVTTPELFFSRAARDPDRVGSAETLLPPGTWAQVRLASDTSKVLDTNPGSLHATPPVLPTGIRPGTSFAVGNPHYEVVVAAQPSRYAVIAAGGVRGDTLGYLVVAIPLADVDHTLHHLLLVELFVASGVLITLAGLAWLVVKLGLRPLEQMQETAGAIAAGDLSQRIEHTDEHTEVGRLGIALNEMLHQIEAAFDERAASEARLRRFVADASHELRTPLTSIRGYAELFRRGAADRPEDLAKTMRRIEEEAARMGILVDDLLLLARLDQGRPLERRPVDLTKLAADAVYDARAIAPDRPIDYTPNGAIVVEGDEARLRQVLANLLQNANRHTPPETPVHVTVNMHADDAVIEVRDEGPGIAHEEAARVFERFWRTDPSRARTSGGVGLGLAIVAAIAEAHGGTASVETTVGYGATFRVRLPRTAPPPEPEPDPEPIAELEDVDADG